MALRVGENDALRSARFVNNVYTNVFFNETVQEGWTIIVCQTLRTGIFSYET